MEQTFGMKAVSEPSPGGGVTVRLAGDMGIEDAEALRQVLMRDLAGPGSVSMDVRQLQSLDLTTVQVICSACRTAAKTGVEFRMEGILPECLRAYRETMGITISLCIHNNERACPWFGGGN